MEPDRHLTPPTHHDTNLAVNSLRCLRPNPAVILISLVVLLTGASDVVRAEAEPPKRVEVMVKGGDTLLRIAARHGVTVEDLRSWNTHRIGKDDLIKIGDLLRIQVDSGYVAPLRDTPAGPQWEGFYDIKRGDTLGRVSKKLKVSIEDLMKWNRLSGKVIKAGDVLAYRKIGERPSARSKGRPTSGAISHSTYLGTGSGYRLRFPRNAYGMPAVSKAIKACVRKVVAKNPGTADILVGDISRPTGGRFPPHQSHQSGRDADIGYYLGGNVQNVTMHRVGASHVDHDKNWDLLGCLVRDYRVVRVYMDKAIQKAMAKHLVKKKRLSAVLAKRLFAERGDRRALIRHAPLHDTHVHVRFACGADDTSCKEEAGDRVFLF
jgi:LysM repeat protein